MLHVKERLNGRNRGGQVNESWERELEWAAAAAAEQQKQAAISMARPIAIGAGLGVLVALAAVLPTLVGTNVIMNLSPTGEIGVAVIAAAIAIAVVPAGLLVPTPTRATCRLVVLTAALCRRARRRSTSS
jgi:hypothetical protein